MRVLLIAPSFFGYREEVARELEKRGSRVDIVSDRPSEKAVSKALGRISYRLVEHGIEKHFERMCAMLRNNHYDVVILLGGMSFCFKRNQVIALKQAAQAPFVFYLWDALGNCQRVGESLDLFDRVFSFEPKDCSRRCVELLPLFYVSAYGDVPRVPEGGFEYDACYIGSVHQVSKFEHVRRIAESLERQGARVFTHYYMPSRLVGTAWMALHPVYRGAAIRFESLGAEQVMDVYAKTRTLIDSPQAGQNGLTIRCIEALGAQRRVITANDRVKKYDIYSTGNYSICRPGTEPDLAFATADPLPVEEELRNRYSISSWVDLLLEGVRI